MGVSSLNPLDLIGTQMEGTRPKPPRFEQTSDSLNYSATGFNEINEEIEEEIGSEDYSDDFDSVNFKQYSDDSGFEELEGASTMVESAAKPAMFHDRQNLLRK